MAGSVYAQTTVLNPTDPIVVYNAGSPPTQPAFGQIGKWVKTNRLSWNTTGFKAYIYKGMPFRLKFPKTYQAGVTDGKKYPVYIFLHGRGEGGTVYDNEYQLAHGGSVFNTATDNGTFDGYLLYAQTTDGTWGNNQFDILKELVTLMATQVKGDLNRILLNGLSAGGYGSWDFMMRYPSLIAGALPMSGIANGNTGGITNFKFTSIWYFQGNLDNSPAPYTAQTVINAIKAAGSNITYTLYPDLGHGTWDRAWSEKDFIPFMNRANVLNPWPLTGRSEFCTGDPINLTVGIAPGFDGYEWNKDGVTITGATTNAINVTALGTYAVRVKRGTVWSEWSPTPLVIKIKAATATPPITIDSLSTNILPAPDGNTTVTLELPDGYASYLWQKVGNSQTLSTTSSLVATPGQYIARVTEQYGCASSFSSPYTVIASAGTNVPDAVSGLIITPVSQTALTLNWTDKSNPQNNETGFEIYRGTQAGGPYKLVGKVNADILTFTNYNLNANTRYYYIIRPVNNNGAGPVSTEANGITQADKQAPTAPGSLTVTNSTTSSVSLSWTASTDNVRVTGYDIYVNGAKAYTVASNILSAVTYGLTERQLYNFYVVAKDSAGNNSAASNQVTAAAINKGIGYKYYEGTWSVLPNFNTLTPVAQGRSNNPDITLRKRETNYSFLWQGFLTIPVNGTYTFATNSDDGSKFYFNMPYSAAATATVNNDGGHGATTVSSAAMTLQAGVYPIAVTYFQGTGGQSMVLSWRSTALGLSALTTIPAQYFGDTLTLPGIAPVAPSILNVTPVSFKKITLNWNDNSDNETGFEIYRSPSNTGTFTIIGKTNTNVTTFDDTQVTANTRYYYKIRAIGKYGESALVAGYQYLSIWPVDSSYQDISLNNTAITSTGLAFNGTDKADGTAAIVFAGTTSSYGIIGGTNTGFLHDAFAARTVAMWIKAGALDNNRIIFDMGGSDNGLALRINVNKLEAGAASGNVRTTVSAAFTSTAWTHVAVVYNNGSLSLYINGTLAASGTTTFTSVAATTSNSRLGLNNGNNAFNANGTFYKGSMDYLTIINQALSPTEVTQLYNKILPIYTAVTLPTPAVPAVPVNLVTTATSPSTISLTWTNNATNATGFEIQRAFGSGSTFVTIKTISTVSGTTGTYTDSSLYANQQYAYKVRAAGEGGYSDYSAAASTVTLNTVPVIQPVSNQSARYDVVTQIPVIATDADEDMLTYTGLGLPSFITVVNNANGVYLNVNPSIAVQGTYNLAVIATDTHNGKDTVSFSLTINDNYSPSLGAVSNVTLNEGQKQVINVTATDQNANDTLTWSGIQLPSFITVTGNNRSAVINVKPGYADAGVYTVNLQSNDGKGGIDTKTFTITVNDKDPNYKLFVRFKYNTDAPLPWNNVTGTNTNNLKNDKGETTTASLLVQNNAWFTWNEGTSAGVYPDVVMKEYYFFGSYPGIFSSSNSIDMKLTGLDSTRKYSFKFFAGSNWSVLANNGTTNFSINGISKSIAVQNNTTNTANFDNIVPDANGEITFNVSVPAGTQVGYLNAFEVNAILDDGTLPAAPKALSAVQQDGIATLNWTNVAYNATGYEVHRATDSLGTYSLLNSISSATAAGYTDSTVHGNTHYYYKVRATNTAGYSQFSDIAGVNVPVKPPFISDIADVLLKAGTNAQVTVHAQGDLQNVVTLTVSGLPSFAEFIDNGSGSGQFSITPTANNLGNYKVTLKATDNQGAAATKVFNINVSDKNTTSTYFNFASTSPADNPWNNISGFPYGNVKTTNALDETGNSTNMSMTFLENWENDAPAVGMSTYEDRGVYPDVVMMSAIYESRPVTHNIKMGGLDRSKKYNFAFFSSINFGIDAKTKFTINNDSVIINPAYNTTKALQLNGVVPDNNGEVNIKVNKVGGGYYMYLNAMVVEAYDSALAVVNPLNLAANATGAKKIALTWSDRANNETGYEIWRAVSGSSYALIATRAANTNTFTDSLLVPNQKYYYKVRAVKGSVNSDYSNTSAATTPGFNVLVNFSELLAAPSPWNNTGMRPQEGQIINNMLDAQTNITGIGINILQNFDGMYSAGINTTNNSGIYPDNVMVENYGIFPGKHTSFNITGLNQSLKYDLVFFASSVEWQDITSKYTVNNAKVTYLNASMNQSGIVTLHDISPDQDGNIRIDIDPGTPTSMYGLIGALTITGHLDPAQQNESGPVDPISIARTTGVAVISDHVLPGIVSQTSLFGTSRVYPNPYQTQFNIDLELKTETTVKLEVFDMSGRLLYSDYKGSVPAGISTLRINTSQSISVPGIYLLRISAKNGETKMLKLVKQ
jgi:predicted esterase